MHLFRGGSFSLYLSFDSIYILKLFIYMLLELFSESSIYLVYHVDSNFLISLLCVVINYQKGEIEASGSLFMFW
jgi:hypothetical protein